MIYRLVTEQVQDSPLGTPSLPDHCVFSNVQAHMLAVDFLPFLFLAECYLAHYHMVAAAQGFPSWVPIPTS